VPHITPARVALLRRLFGCLQWISPRLAAARSLQLFLRTYRRPLRPEDAALLARARRQRIAMRHGSAVVYEWAAAGPTVIILHGWGSRAARFTLLAQALHARGWRVLAIDAPGHGSASGRSSSLVQFMDCLDAVIHRCGPPQALIGHSLGALAIACRFGAAPPEWATAVRTVVLVGMPESAEFLLRKFIQLLALSPATERRLRARFQARFGQTPQDFASLPGAARIGARLLIMHDRSDDIVPCEHSAQLLAQLPAAQFVITEGLGHSALTRDAGTIARIVEFLAWM